VRIPVFTDDPFLSLSSISIQNPKKDTQDSFTSASPKLLRHSFLSSQNRDSSLECGNAAFWQ